MIASKNRRLYHPSNRFDFITSNYKQISRRRKALTMCLSYCLQQVWHDLCFNLIRVKESSEFVELLAINAPMF
jgi:hypothetical protein